MSILEIAPNDLYEKLEFDKILRLVEGYCYGASGKSYFENLQVSTDSVQIERWLQEVTEYCKTYEHNHNFPISRYGTIEEDLKMLAIEDFVLSIESLRNVSKILLLTHQIYDFFYKRKSTKNLYPSLFDIVSTLQLDKALLDEIHRVIDDEGEIRSDASPELMRIARMQGSKRQELDGKFRQITVHYQGKGWLSDYVESFRNGRRVLAVPAEHKRQVRGIIHDESSTGKTVFIEPEGVIDINNDIYELERAYKREIYNLLKSLSALLRPFIYQLASFEQIIIRFDCIQAKAQLAQLLQAEKPVLLAKPHFKMRNIKHPLLYLKNQQAGEPTVPFHLQLKEDTRILVLSGPNAGGKSVCMKAVGLIQLMVQAGMLLPINEGGEVGVFKKIFADIGDQQSLEDELSTYSSRLQNAKHFMKYSDEDTLVLIDEFGSGTDPKMGGAIAEAILRDLNRRKVYGVITTHYSNLKVFAFDNKGLVNGSMIFDKDTLSPTYRMRVGKPGSSYAFEIATKSGLPNNVIDYARKRVGKQEHTYDNMLVDLQKERQKTLEAREDLLTQQQKLNQLIKNYEYAFRELEFGRKKLKLEKKEQELVDLQQNQKELQRLMREIRAEKDNSKKEQQAQHLFDRTKESRKKVTEKVHNIKEKIYERYELLDDEEIIVGSHVKLRVGGGTGIVTEIKKKEALVEMGNISLMIKIRDLQAIKNPIVTHQTAVVKTSTLKSYAQFETRIDIRGMRYEDALERIQEFVDSALMASVPEITIVHGKGSGALRKVVQKKLKEYQNIHRVYHPEQRQGGNGVTIIEL